MTTLTGSYNGLTIGAGTKFPVTALSGMDDMPAIKRRDISRQAYDGDVSSPDLSDSRTVTVSFGLRGESPAELISLKQQLRTATAPQVAPLLLTLGSFAVFAKPRRRTIPDDRSVDWKIGEAVVEFYCSDPRVYSATENVVSTGLAVSTGGFSFPFSFPFSFGSGASGGGITALNSGNVNSPVKITYRGQLTNPGSQLSATGQRLKMTLAMDPADALLLDSETHAVTLNGVASRRAFLTIDQWFSLPPGSSFVTFETDGSGGVPTMELRWRSAWL